MVQVFSLIALYFPWRVPLWSLLFSLANVMRILGGAAENGHGAVVKLLLAKDGVNPGFKADKNRTPLIIKSSRL